MTGSDLEPVEDFKERELETLSLVAEDRSNKGIADRLSITVGTVRWHNKQIYSKFGTSCLALAPEMGLVGDKIYQPLYPMRSSNRISRSQRAPLSCMTANSLCFRNYYTPEFRLLSVITQAVRANHTSHWN